MPGEAKVNDFDITLATDKDIGRFQVTMHEIATLAMIQVVRPNLHIQQTAENLVEQGFYVLLAPASDLIRVPHDLCHVPSSVFLAFKMVKNSIPE